MVSFIAENNAYLCVTLHPQLLRESVSGPIVAVKCMKLVRCAEHMIWHQTLEVTWEGILNSTL